MSERQELEIRRKLASGVSESEELDLRRQLASLAPASKPDVKASVPDDIREQQQEIMDRMSDDIPTMLESDINRLEYGTGETLGQFARRPEVLRTGLELGGMLVGGATAPLLATRIASRAPAALSALNKLRAASPIATEAVTRATGAGIGGAVGSLAAEPIAPSGDPINRAIETGTFGVLGEGIGGFVGKGAQLIKPKLREGADVAQRVLQRYKGTLTPGEASVPGAPLQVAEGIARTGVTGRQAFKQLDEINEAAIQSAKGELLDTISRFRPGDDRTGKLFVAAIEKGKKAHKAAASKRYAALDEKTQIPVDLTDLKSSFEQLGSSLKKIGDVGKTERGGRLIDQLSKVEPNLTFKEAHELRSSLLSTARDLKASGQESIALRNVRDAISKVEKAMDDAAKAAGSNVYKEYRETSAFFRRGKDAFTNDIIEKAISTNPERIGEYLFKTGNVSEITQAKAALRQAARHDPSIDTRRVWQSMKSGFLEAKLTGKGMTNVEGETIAKNFLKELAEKKHDRTMQAMFSPHELAKIKEFAITTMRTTAKKGQTSELGVIVPIVQATAFVDMVTFQFNNPYLDAAVIVTPYALARMATNPRVVNMMIRAMTTPPSTSKGAAIATQLGQEINRLNQEAQERE